LLDGRKTVFEKTAKKKKKKKRERPEKHTQILQAADIYVYQSFLTPSSLAPTLLMYMAL